MIKTLNQHYNIILSIRYIFNTIIIVSIICIIIQIFNAFNAIMSYKCVPTFKSDQLHINIFDYYVYEFRQLI